MPPLSFFRSSAGAASSSGGQTSSQPQSQSQSQSQAQTPQPTSIPPDFRSTSSLSGSRVPTPPSPRTQDPAGFPGGPSYAASPGSNSTISTATGKQNNAGTYQGQNQGEPQSQSNSQSQSYSPGRFGSGSWARGKKPRFSSAGMNLSGVGSGGPGASPTRSGYGHEISSSSSTATATGLGEEGVGGGGGGQKGGRRMMSITEGIPITSSSASAGSGSGSGSGFIPGSIIGGGRLSEPSGVQSASPSGSFPVIRSQGSGSGHSHTHHLSLSLAPSNSNSNSGDMPPPSPRARPKPRGYSESGNANGEKRRAGWFAGFGPGSGSGSGMGGGSRSDHGHGVGTGQEEREKEKEGRTKRLGSGSSVLSNPFSSSAREDQGTTGQRGSLEEPDNVFGSASTVGRSASFKIGFRNRVSSSSKAAGGVSGLNISAPIGPMVKASQEEILQEFGRLQMNPSAAGQEGIRDARSTSWDQGLKARSSSFSVGERPSMNASSVGEDRMFRLPSRETLPNVPNTAPIQRPVTPDRTPVPQMPGTPLAQTRSGSYNGNNAAPAFPTPLSPPMRRPTVVSRQSGQSPAPLAWPSRGVEAGCLSPRQPARKDSGDVYSSAGEGQASIFRASSSVESKANPDTVEWLSRKPSSTFDHHSREFSLGPARPIDERSVKRKPAPLFPQSAGTPQLPHLEKRASDDSQDHDRTYSTSGFEADDDSEEQLSSVEDAVISRAERVVSPRKDSFSSTSFSVTTTPPRSPAMVPRDAQEEFQVETVCVPSADGETMRWEIVVRRQPAGSSSTGSTSTALNGPVQLSQTRTTTRAPISASSVNLSLSLDRPSGKLAFLSLPTATSDPHATPIRSRANHPSAIGTAKTRMDNSPGPASASPSPSPYTRESGLGRSASIRASDPSAITSPTFAPSARTMRSGDRRQISSSSVPMWPNSPLSPGAPITPVSPPGSPRDVVVRERRKASLQGGVLYTRTHDNQV